MIKYISVFSFLLLLTNGISQAKVDLDRSVPVWMEYDTSSNFANLNWIADENAANYYVSKVTNGTNLMPLVTLDGDATGYIIGLMTKGEKLDFHVRKDIVGRGIISVGIELPALHERGRCLIAIDDILSDSLVTEINQLIEDITMDGWEVDTLHIPQSAEVVKVKTKIKEWYDETYGLSQTLFLLGHIPVPYSGNTQHDGHNNHQGAWAADVFYGELNGNWTDSFVDNTTPSRAKNDNIPGDGKYDQTSIPSNVELEVGRVDFHDLPAFEKDEIELTRQYLNKNHEFKIGNKEYPRRALVENNFSGFAEGFGQSGWRNFPTMFGGDSVSVKNYDVVLESNKYLFSYACGGGSYTSCSGVGTTQNLWATKDLQTVFTLNFGSYFGDWDSQNNFLRAALGSGDILVNAWSGRPIWQLYDMALGKHIGVSTKLSQDAFGTFYSQGNSAKSAHIALMGDPTLRLHAIKPAEALTATFFDGDNQLDWSTSADASHGYFVYRRESGTNWQLVAEFVESTSFLDYCVNSNTNYEYMVKAVKLERSGSGSYFNTSLGISTSILTGENPNLNIYYADNDMDGYGNAFDVTMACNIPLGFIDNFMDCDDTNADINPDGIEIPNNGIDEDCDGVDLLVGVEELEELEIVVYPNPTSGLILIGGEKLEGLRYRLYNVRGEVVKSGGLVRSIDISGEVDGLYWLEVRSIQSGIKYSEKILLTK